MKAIATTVALVAAAVALVAAAVFGLGDRRMFVSPPEAVVENFMRALQRGRFPQARKYLSADVRGRTSTARLAEAKARLESRIGAIQDVKGEEGWMAGEEAEAAALLATRKTGKVRLSFRLHRETGEWRVGEIEGLLP